MKHLLHFIIPVMVFFTTGISHAQTPKGHLVIIGGGLCYDSLMAEFVKLGGGTKAKILIVPYASGDKAGTAKYKADLCTKNGAAEADWVLFSREELDTPEGLAKLEGKTGVFFSGGDQVDLTNALLGTKFFAKIKKMYMDGAVIGGTSAGAAVMSNIMITGNELINKDEDHIFGTINAENVEVKQGFGFLNSVIIDQHFFKRRRLPRLLSVCLEKNMTGIGIDESTAAIISKGNELRVMGYSGILIYEPENSAMRRSGKMISAAGVKLHVLHEGDTYLIKEKKVTLKKGK